MSGKRQTRISVREKIWKRTMVTHGSFFLRKSGTVSVKTVHKESGTKLQKGCCWNLPKADVQFSVLRAHCPEVKSKAKDVVNCRYTLQPIWKRLRAVEEICEECESLRERTGRPIVMGQSSSSLVISVIKTEVPLDCDDPAKQDLLFQQYGERIERLSQQDKLSRFCMDTEFLSVVENGQYFMTKDTADLSQFHAVACRQYTLPREELASQLKRWIQGNTKIGPVSEVATSYLQSKYGVEIRIWSLNRDNTHSSVRISHGSNKFVMNLSNNETESPEDQLGEHALKLNAKDVACQSKTKSKPQRREPDGSSPRIVPIVRRNWIDIEPGNILSPIMRYRRKSRIFFVTHNMCIEKKMKQFISGESKKIFRNISHTLFIGLMVGGKYAWQEEEIKEDSSPVLMLHAQLFISELFRDIQDAILLNFHYRTM